MGGGNLSQQNLVSLVPSLNQGTTGRCVAGPVPTPPVPLR